MSKAKDKNLVIFTKKRLLAISFICFVIIFVISLTSKIANNEKPLEDKSRLVVVTLAKSPKNDKKKGLNKKIITRRIHSIKNYLTINNNDPLETLKESNHQAYDHVILNRQLRQEGYGTLAPIKDITKPQVKSVLKALQSGHFPERLSPSIPPAAFDANKFLNDSSYATSYMETVEPGRVLQSSSSEKAQAIKRLSPYLQNVIQGQKVSLAVRCEAGFPCTFTTYDNGTFNNGLSSQTVLADSNGYASVNFHGISGVGGDSKISCSSPVNSSRIKFIVTTQTPNRETKK
jgi:hypothetical protein